MGMRRVNDAAFSSVRLLAIDLLITGNPEVAGFSLTWNFQPCLRSISDGSTLLDCATGAHIMRTIKLFILCLAFIAAITPAWTQSADRDAPAESTITEPHNYRPPAGYVPDAATAIRIAEAVLIPVYGEANVAAERPFYADLNVDVWTVRGTLHCSDTKAQCMGGVAEVKLSRNDGRILRITHGK